jgi:hypothetical protein
MYPSNWPRCPGCGEPALDGKKTCGEVKCTEAPKRRHPLQILVGLKPDGTVGVHFSQTINWLSLSPPAALQLADRLQELAGKALFGDALDQPKRKEHES